MFKSADDFVTRRVTPFRAMVFCCLMMTTLVTSRWSPKTGFTELLGFGELRVENQTILMRGMDVYFKPGSGGYDSQQYAQVALDPSLTHPDFDHAENFLNWPAYRARRIGMPLVAHVLGFGRPWWIFTVFALINPVVWALFATLVWRWLKPVGWFDFARWFLACFSLGAVESVRLAQLDLPALLLLLAPILAPGSFGALGRGAMAVFAVFTKETAVLGFLGLPLGRDRHRLRAFALTALTTGLLYGLWLAYVYSRFGSSKGDTDNLRWPFAGLVVFVREALDHFVKHDYDSRYLFGLPGVAALIFQTGWMIRRCDWRSPLWRMAAGSILLVPFMGVMIWGGHWNAARVLLPLTVAFCLLYDRRDKTGWGILLLANVSVIHGFVRCL